MHIDLLRRHNLNPDEVYRKRSDKDIMTKLTMPTKWSSNIEYLTSLPYPWFEMQVGELVLFILLVKNKNV